MLAVHIGQVWVNNNKKKTCVLLVAGITQHSILLSEKPYKLISTCTDTGTYFLWFKLHRENFS